MQLFRSDLSTAVDEILSMPDNERKREFIGEVTRSLRSLKTSVTINSHFMVLSSLLVGRGATEIMTDKVEEESSD
jgi:hypothetical protein